MSFESVYNFVENIYPFHLGFCYELIVFLGKLLYVNISCRTNVKQSRLFKQTFINYFLFATILLVVPIQISFFFVFKISECLI